MFYVENSFYRNNIEKNTLKIQIFIDSNVMGHSVTLKNVKFFPKISETCAPSHPKIETSKTAIFNCYNDKKH